MILDLFHRKNYSSDYLNNNTMMIINPSPDVVDGKIVKSSEYIVYNFVEYASQFKASDFALSNLIAIGATDMLVPVSMTCNSNMVIADKFQDFTTTLKEQTNV